MFTRAGWNRTTLPFAIALAVVVIVVANTGGPVATVVGVIAVVAGVVAVSASVHRWDMGAARLLDDALERMTAGDWSARVRLRGEDELGECGFRLNLLAERTAEQIDGLTRQATDLAAIVDALPDAVLLTDAQQRTVRVNEPAAKFLGITTRQATGQPLLAVLGEAQLVEAYEDSLDAAGDAGPILRDIRVTRGGQRLTYQAVAARTAAGGVLIALRDVTEMTEAVRMKTDFVANASHELRTPIAAIKIAFETLTDVLGDARDNPGSNDPALTDRCLTIIAGHLRRLEEMLQDLLDLSRVEDTDAEPDYAPLTSAGLLATVMNTMGSLAADKGVTLEAEGDAEFVSDRRLLDLVLKNLVENAVKYTPPGGRVTATIERDADDADGPGRGGFVVRVADTGIGIPPQHAERVFERFYQVDPARSGSGGRGTGLGLAIVKHAAAALGGKVNLSSVVGRGTTVSCSFPDAGASNG